MINFTGNFVNYVSTIDTVISTNSFTTTNQPREIATGIVIKYLNTSTRPVSGQLYPRVMQ